MGSLFPPLDREESCGCRGEYTAEVMLCNVSGWGVEGRASCGSFSWDTLFWSLSCPVNHPPEVSTCVCAHGGEWFPERTREKCPGSPSLCTEVGGEASG